MCPRAYSLLVRTHLPLKRILRPRGREFPPSVELQMSHLATPTRQSLQVSLSPLLVSLFLYHSSFHDRSIQYPVNPTFTKPYSPVPPSPLPVSNLFSREKNHPPHTTNLFSSSPSSSPSKSSACKLYSPLPPLPNFHPSPTSSFLHQHILSRYRYRLTTAQPSPARPSPVQPGTFVLPAPAPAPASAPATATTCCLLKEEKNKSMRMRTTPTPNSQGGFYHS